MLKFVDSHSNHGEFEDAPVLISNVILIYTTFAVLLFIKPLYTLLIAHAYNSAYADWVHANPRKWTVERAVKVISTQPDSLHSSL